MLSKTDLQILDEEGISFGIMMFLYVSSIGIVWILAMILTISIFCFESTVYKIFLKYVKHKRYNFKFIKNVALELCRDQSLVL